MITTATKNRGTYRAIVFGRALLLVLLLLVLLLVALLVGCARSADKAALEAEKGTAGGKSAAEVESGLKAYERGDFETAVSELETAVDKDPKNVAAQTALGQSYEAVGKLKQAEESYRSALELDQNLPRIRYKLAIILKSKGRPEEAIDELKDAIGAEPDFAAARLILGDLYADAGDKEKAAAEYRAVIDSKPFGIDLKPVEAKLAEVE